MNSVHDTTRHAERIANILGKRTWRSGFGQLPHGPHVRKYDDVPLIVATLKYDDDPRGELLALQLDPERHVRMAGTMPIPHVELGVHEVEQLRDIFTKWLDELRPPEGTR